MLNIPVADAQKAKHQGVVQTIQLGEVRVTPGEAKKSIAATIELARLVRKHGETLTTQAFQIVMEVALEPGVTAQTLEKRTGLTQASVSRNLAALGEYHRIGRKGLNLVESVEDPIERRRKISFLTKAGREFVSDVLSLQHGERIVFEAPNAREYLSKAYSGNIR